MEHDGFGSDGAEMRGCSKNLPRRFTAIARDRTRKSQEKFRVAINKSSYLLCLVFVSESNHYLNFVPVLPYRQPHVICGSMELLALF
jgi:hypothetical protein